MQGSLYEPLFNRQQPTPFFRHIICNNVSPVKYFRKGTPRNLQGGMIKRIIFLLWPTSGRAWYWYQLLDVTVQWDGKGRTIGSSCLRDCILHAVFFFLRSFKIGLYETSRCLYNTDARRSNSASDDITWPKRVSLLVNIDHVISSDALSLSVVSTMLESEKYVKPV